MTKFNFATVRTAFEADWPVEVLVPQDGGTTEKQEFSVRFRLLDDAEFEAAQASKDPARELIRKAVVGFGKDTEETFSPELLEQMLARGYVRLALNKAYGAFSMGVAAKN